MLNRNRRNYELGEGGGGPQHKYLSTTLPPQLKALVHRRTQDYRLQWRGFTWWVPDQGVWRTEDLQ